MQLLRSITALLVCVLASSAVASSQSHEPPYEINVLAPLTGAGAFFGKSYVEGLTALEGVVNASGGIKGRPVKFVISDSQTSGPVGLQIVNSLIAKHAALFIDGGPSPVCLPSIPLVEKSGPLDYCLSPLIYPVPRSYVLSAGASSIDLMAVAIRFFRSKGMKRLAMISTTDSSGQSYDRAITVVLARPENRDVQIVAAEHFGGTDISASAQLARIESAKPQALMLMATGTPAGTVLRGLKDAGSDLPVLTGNSNMTWAQMKAYEGLLPKELYFTTLRGLLPEATLKGPLRDAQQVYVKAMRAANIRPDIGHSLVWDPGMLFVDALRSVGTAATAEQLQAWVLSQRSWVGINGVYDFASGDQRGLGDGSIVIARWNAARGTWLQASGPKGVPQ